MKVGMNYYNGKNYKGSEFSAEPFLKIKIMGHHSTFLTSGAT
jgi:hypothetical protein